MQTSIWLFDSTNDLYPGSFYFRFCLNNHLMLGQFNVRAAIHTPYPMRPGGISVLGSKLGGILIKQVSFV